MTASHARRRSRPGRTAVLAAGWGISWGTGIFLISWGNHLAAQDYYYDVSPWGAWGAFFLLLPLLVIGVMVLIALGRAVAAERRRYAAWKATLTPRERTLVEAAELAAMSAAAIMAWQHNREVSARLTASVIGQPYQRPVPLAEYQPPAMQPPVSSHPMRSSSTVPPSRAR